MSSVYLLCLNQPFHHARHYIGVSYDNNPLPRVELHRAGRSRVTFIRAVVRAGIAFQLTRVWYGAGRKFERALKDRKDSASLCPRCSGERAWGNGVWRAGNRRSPDATSTLHSPPDGPDPLMLYVRDLREQYTNGANANDEPPTRSAINTDDIDIDVSAQIQNL